LCIILLIFFIFDAAFGIPVLLTTIISLIGASVAICCCQTYVGLWWNYVLFAIASLGRLILFIALCVTRLGLRYNGLYILYVICMLLGSASGAFFWEYGRRAIKSLIEEGRTDPDIIYQNRNIGQNAIALSTVATSNPQPVPAAAVIVQPYTGTYSTDQHVPQYAIHSPQPIGYNLPPQYPQHVAVHGHMTTASPINNKV